MAGKNFTSSEKVDDSDLANDSSSPEDEQPNKRDRAQPPPHKRKAPAPAAQTTPAKRQKVVEAAKVRASDKPATKSAETANRQGTVQTNGSGEDEEDGSASESTSSSSQQSSDSASDESGSEGEESGEGTASRPSPPRKNGFIALPRSQAIAYSPPSGFEPFEKIPQNTTLQDILSSANLAGKQLWHITAPAGFPLDKMRNITLSAANISDKVLSFDGADYALAPGKQMSRDEVRLLGPKKDGTHYQAFPNTFEETFSIQQVVSRQGPTSNAGAATAKATKPVVPQPEGLRTRYWPPGFEPATISNGTNRPTANTSSKRSSINGLTKSAPDTSSPESDNDSDEPSQPLPTRPIDRKAAREASSSSSTSSDGDSSSESTVSEDESDSGSDSEAQASRSSEDESSSAESESSSSESESDSSSGDDVAATAPKTRASSGALTNGHGPVKKAATDTTKKTRRVKG